MGTAINWLYENISYSHLVIPKNCKTIKKNEFSGKEDTFGMGRGLKHIKIPLETFVSSNAFRENYQDIDREYY